MSPTIHYHHIFLKVGASSVPGAVQLLQMWVAQAQGIGRFQANDQSAHVPVRRLHERKVCIGQCSSHNGTRTGIKKVLQRIFRRIRWVE